MSYVSVLTKPRQKSPQDQTVRGDGPLPAIGRRNVVQLRWECQGSPPARKVLIELILPMPFKSEEIFAFMTGI